MEPIKKCPSLVWLPLLITTWASILWWIRVLEISKAFKRYARSYKIEIIYSKDSLAQLEASKLSVEDLFKDLLHEIKGFKYKITVTVLLFKHKINVDWVCSCLF